MLYLASRCLHINIMNSIKRQWVWMWSETVLMFWNGTETLTNSWQYSQCQSEHTLTDFNFIHLITVLKSWWRKCLVLNPITWTHVHLKTSFCKHNKDNKVLHIYSQRNVLNVIQVTKWHITKDLIVSEINETYGLNWVMQVKKIK